MDIDNYPAPEPENFENFGGLQYIIDRLPPHEQFIVTAYFVYDLSKTDVVWLTGFSTETVERVLRNLARIDLTGNEPMIKFRGKMFVLGGLDGRNYR